MEDKEKQAIEKIYNGKKMDLISIIRTFKREGIENFVVTKKETVETVLNLIEKQQSEMFKLQAKADRLKVARDNWKKTFYQAKAEIENKDKIIDEMAEHIVSSAIVDDTVCAIKCDCDNGVECSHKKMLKCTKDYFKKKVEDK